MSRTSKVQARYIGKTGVLFKSRGGLVAQAISREGRAFPEAAFLQIGTQSAQ